MKTKIIFQTAIAALLLATISCTKDDTTLPNTNQSTAPTPVFSDGYGALAALQTTTYVTVAGITLPTEINTAVAAFPETAGSTKFLDAGEVSLNSKVLTKYDNNTYLYDNLMVMLDFSQLQWKVAGKGDVPAVNATVTKPMPEFTGYNTLPAAVTKSSGLTINLAGQLTNADSLFVLVLDLGSGSATKRVKGNAASVVFSASDLSSLTAGQGMIEVVPWNYTTQTFSGKKMYFVNESAYVKSGVTIN